MRADTAAARDTCWILTDDKVGMRVQCRGLAEALGCTPVMKRIVPCIPWRWLPPSFWGAPLKAGGAGSDPLMPPWPRLLIATGRVSAAPAMAVKKVAGDDLLAFQIQDPRLPPWRYDAVIVPAHDRLRGDNVLVSLGALNPLTERKLAGAAATLAPGLADIPSPRVVVALGGDTRHYRFTGRIAAALASRLRGLSDAGCGLLITPSRRTAAKRLKPIQTALAGRPARIWDGSGDNPYVGWLGLADHVVVTGDSVNMVSEAAFTGKPVHVVALAGKSGKFDRFHRAMAARGCVRPLDLTAGGPLPDFTFEPLRETARIAAELRARFGDRLPA